jgi:type II secretory pathway component PulK
MRRNTPGFVLVCVLWVLAILTVVTVGFGQRAMLDRRAAAYSLDAAQARLNARAAAERGIIELRNKAFTDAMKPKELGMTHLGQPWARPTSLLKDNKYLEALGDDFKDDDVWFVIEDEESRVNVNLAPDKLLESLEALKRPVMRQISARRKEAIHKDEGLSPFQAIEEIRYLRNVDDDDWFGTKRQTGLKYLLTVNGDGKINLNTAPEEVLESIPGLGARAVGVVMNHRRGPDGELGTGDDRGFLNLEDLSNQTGISGDAYEAVQANCKFTSDCFRITGLATRRGGTVRSKCSAVAWISGSNANVIEWQEESFGS